MLFTPILMSKDIDSQEEKSFPDRYERLKWALTMKKTNLKKVIEELEISLSGFRKGIESGSLSPKYVIKLAKILDVGVEDVINGVYSVVEKSEAVDNYQAGIEAKVVRFTTSDTKNLPGQWIPLIDFRNLSLSMPISNLLESENFPVIPAQNHRSQFAFIMQGDSMAGLIESGYRVEGRIVKDFDDLEPTAVYVVITANHNRVRYIEILPDGMMRLKCHNKAYPDVDIPKSKIEGMVHCTAAYKVTELP